MENEQASRKRQSLLQKSKNGLLNRQGEPWVRRYLRRPSQSGVGSGDLWDVMKGSKDQKSGASRHSKEATFAAKYYQNLKHIRILDESGE